MVSTWLWKSCRQIKAKSSLKLVLPIMPAHPIESLERLKRFKQELGHSSLFQLTLGHLVVKPIR